MIEHQLSQVIAHLEQVQSLRKRPRNIDDEEAYLVDKRYDGPGVDESGITPSVLNTEQSDRQQTNTTSIKGR